jgi:hypothetical protein
VCALHSIVLCTNLAIPGVCCQEEVVPLMTKRTPSLGALIPNGSKPIRILEAHQCYKRTRSLGPASRPNHFLRQYEVWGCVQTTSDTGESRRRTCTLIGQPKFFRNRPCGRLAISIEVIMAGLDGPQLLQLQPKPV